jgi:FKBP-type peptidyl-prolyl cis-trans isomerase
MLYSWYKNKLRMNVKYFILIVVSALFLSACTHTGSIINDDFQSSGTASEEKKPEEEAVMEVKELIIEDLVEGEGKEASQGATVTVHYVGTFPDGSKFDSSIDRDDPFSFQLGAGRVIEGWDQGVSGMKVGGKRKLTIPSHLAYGEQGQGSVIPPNSTLVFEIELLEVN